MSNFAQDMKVKAAYRLSLAEWNALTDKERRDKRDNVTTAPHFQENQ
jgi:hypothetical protein